MSKVFIEVNFVVVREVKDDSGVMKIILIMIMFFLLVIYFVVLFFMFML